MEEYDRDRSRFLEVARKPQPCLFRGGEGLLQVAALGRQLRRLLRLPEEHVRVGKCRVDASNQVLELPDLLFQGRDSLTHRSRGALLLLNGIGALACRS